MSRLGGGNESHTSSLPARITQPVGSCSSHLYCLVHIYSLSAPHFMSYNSSTSRHAFRSFDRLPDSPSRGDLRFSLDLHL